MSHIEGYAEKRIPERNGLSKALEDEDGCD
jgi:hypothetical protein